MAGVRIPAAFRAQHELAATWRKHAGSSHAYGRECTVPVARYPWRCSCGAEGREGGARGHRGHVVEAYRATLR